MMAIHAKEIKSTRVNFILNLRYKTFFDKGLQKKYSPYLVQNLIYIAPFLFGIKVVRDTEFALLSVAATIAVFTWCL